MFCLHPSVCLFVCPFIHPSIREQSEQNYAKSFKAIFMKSYRIMDYCYGKNVFSFGVDPTQNGRMAAISDFCYNIRVWMSVDVSRGMCSTEGLLVTGVNSRAVPNCGFILVGKYR